MAGILPGEVHDDVGVLGVPVALCPAGPHPGRVNRARPTWSDLPAVVRAALEEVVGGQVTAWSSQPSGYSPGLADRVTAATGDRYFVKAVNAHEYPDTAGMRPTGPMAFASCRVRQFHERSLSRRVPVSFIEDVFDVMRATPQHTHQVLTKRAIRARRLADYLDWPINMWLGASVESAAYFGRSGGYVLRAALGRALGTVSATVAVTPVVESATRAATALGSRVDEDGGLARTIVLIVFNCGGRSS